MESHSAKPSAREDSWLPARLIPTSGIKGAEEQEGRATSEYKVYNRLPEEGYNHRRINHSAKVYVSGDVHTNTIEGFWSLVKRGIDGVYHSVSAKHLQGYLNEYTWRYNARHAPQARFEALLGRAALGS